MHGRQMSSSNPYNQPTYNLSSPAPSTYPYPPQPAHTTPPVAPYSVSPYPPYPTPTNNMPAPSYYNKPFAPSGSTTYPTPNNPTPAYPAPEDPIKPLRKNVEDSLKEKMEKFVSQKKAEIVQSLSEGDSLKEEYDKLSKDRNFLQEEKRKNAELESHLKRQYDELSHWVEQHDKAENQINIDQITEPEIDVNAQLLHLQAEDLAIEDTQYYLDKALQKASIDLNSYLKATRSLSEEQFFIRALINKIYSMNTTQQQGRAY